MKISETFLQKKCGILAHMQILALKRFLVTNVMRFIAYIFPSIERRDDIMRGMLQEKGLRYVERPSIIIHMSTYILLKIEEEFKQLYV